MLHWHPERRSFHSVRTGRGIRLHIDQCRLCINQLIPPTGIGKENSARRWYLSQSTGGWVTAQCFPRQFGHKRLASKQQLARCCAVNSTGRTQSHYHSVSGMFGPRRASGRVVELWRPWKETRGTEADHTATWQSISLALKFIRGTVKHRECVAHLRFLARAVNSTYSLLLTPTMCSGMQYTPILQHIIQDSGSVFEGGPGPDL